MNKSTIAIVLLIILSAIGFGLFWNSKNERDQNKAVQQSQMIESEAEKARLAAEAEALRKEREMIAAKAEAEAEARRMAEALAKKAEAEKSQLIADLNQRLAKEAAERLEAEAAQKALAERMAALAESQRIAQKRLAELEKAKASTEPSPEALVMQKQLEEQKTQLALLEKENSRLKSKQEELLKKQIDTEDAIIKAGGRIEVPYPEMLSPNFRRREAVRFKERVAPQP